MSSLDPLDFKNTMKQTTSCSPSSGCCSPNRRDFLRFTGLGAAAFFSPRVFAGPFEVNANAHSHNGRAHPAGKPVPHRVESIDGRLAIVFAQSQTLSPGQILEVKA